MERFILPLKTSISVKKEKKAATDRYTTELEKTVDHLQQENKDLQQRLADMKKKHKRAKKRSSSLDGISLLVEAAKEI